jgi:predicted RNA-binding Zn-ribbon protein involved in translation (DUF1610 family)
MPIILADKNEITVGRSARMDISISGTQVSSSHAILSRRVDGWEITDDNSRNGVYVNGKRVMRTTLYDNDTAFIGGWKLLYVNGEIHFINTVGNMVLSEAFAVTYPKTDMREPPISEYQSDLRPVQGLDVKSEVKSRFNEAAEHAMNDDIQNRGSVSDSAVDSPSKKNIEGINLRTEVPELRETQYPSVKSEASKIKRTGGKKMGKKTVFMYCPKCGTHMTESTTCPNCGNMAMIDPSGKNMPGYKYKSKWVAFFLCLFLGYLGVHEFYLGKIGFGLVQLFTLNFFGFGWLVDIVLILFNNYRDKNGFPLI